MKIRKFSNKLQLFFSVAAEFWDERYSSDIIFKEISNFRYFNATMLGLLNYKKLKDYILVHNGDVISDLNIYNLLKFHKDSQSDITVCAKEKTNSSPFGQIFFKGHKIKKILEKPNSKNFINAGIYIFKKKVIKNILPKKLDITSLIETKISSGLNVNIYPIYEYWVDIGRKDILKGVPIKQKASLN